MVGIHGVLVSIILDRDAQFTAQFLNFFIEKVGYKSELKYCISSSYLWASRVHYSYNGGYIVGVHDQYQRELIRSSTSHRVRLQ